MKKLITLLLSFALVTSNLTVAAFAQETTEQEPIYYVAFGDSVTAGYNLPDTNSYQITSVSMNYKNDPELCYSHIVGEELLELQGSDADLYDYYSNIGTCGGRLSESDRIFTDPDFCNSSLVYYGHSLDELYFYDLYMEELNKADLLTIQYGNNDLMKTLLMQMGSDCKGDNYTTVPYTYNGKNYTMYDNVDHPVLTMANGIVVQIITAQAEDADDIQELVKAYIAFYSEETTQSKLTLDDLQYTLEYLQEDNLEEIIISNAKDSEIYYPELINTIRSINENIQIMVIGYYSAFGNSLEVDGVEYDLQYCIQEINKIIVKNIISSGVGLTVVLHLNELLNDNNLIDLNALVDLIGEEKLNEVSSAIMSEVADEMTYPLAYLIMGRVAETGADEMNDYVSNMCANDDDLIYVDISNIPNENNIDPHPNATGHAYIAKQILNAIEENDLIGKINELKTEKTEEEEPKEFPFTDVPEDKWYRSYVEDVYELGIMTGTTTTTFSPSANITRGQLATILYRMAGSPSVDSTESFSDVAQGKYYTDAIAWCKESGVVTGYNDGTFRPSQSITRQELAVMLMRYADYCGVKGEADLSVLNDYPDAGDISGWAKEGMAWAVQNNLISGSQGNLMPKGNATRGQTAKMILAVNDLLAK